MYNMLYPGWKLGDIELGDIEFHTVKRYARTAAMLRWSIPTVCQLNYEYPIEEL